jgi:RNA polymerase sigma factor (sigma-70 family)
VATVHQIGKDYCLSKSQAKKIVSQIRYEDYKDLIFERAWHWASRTGWDIDELIAEGNLIFMNSLRKFNPAKSRFSTYLHHSLDLYLMAKCFTLSKRSKEVYEPQFVSMTSSRKHMTQAEGEEEESKKIEPDKIPGYLANPEDIAALKEMIRRLSKDARTLVKCVLETPKDLIEMARGESSHGTVRVSLNTTVRRYFIERKKWTLPRFMKAAKQVKVALATL